MSSVVYVGVSEPEQLTLDLGPGPSGVDLSEVSAASLFVRRPDGVETSWPVTMSEQSATTLRLTHVFDIDDVDVPGTYVLVARLTVPGGFIRSKPRSLAALGAFDPTGG
jgi:hypothetical protein